MGYTLTQEERIILSEIQSDLIKAKGNLIFSLISVLKYLISTVRIFIISLEEFKLQNIQKHGLGEILSQRAMRFFKLEERAERRKVMNRSMETSNAFKPKNGIRAVKLLVKMCSILLYKLFRLKKMKKKPAKNVYRDKFG